MLTKHVYIKTMGHSEDCHEPTSSGSITLYDQINPFDDRVSFVYESNESSPAQSINIACNPKK